MQVCKHSSLMDLNCNTCQQFVLWQLAKAIFPLDFLSRISGISGNVADKLETKEGYCMSHTSHARSNTILFLFKQKQIFAHAGQKKNMENRNRKEKGENGCNSISHGKFSERKSNLLKISLSRNLD